MSHRIQTFVLHLLTVAAFSSFVVAVADDSKSIKWHTGEALRRELDEPLSANWTRESPREMINALMAAHRVAVVLDRRLDPSREFPMNLQNLSLAEGFARLAELIYGQISITDNFVFIGPKTAAERLRTIIELAQLELASKETGIPQNRRKELQRKSTFHWQDLDTPREILQAIATKSQLKITNLDLVPHDLWAQTALPDVTAIEALSVVLIQFDLSFRWIDETTIELISIRDPVAIERKYRTKQKPAEALAQIRDAFPDADARISQGQILVIATVEDHDAIRNLLQGRSTAQPANDRNKLNALRQRTFTFKSPPAPASAIMKKIEETDIRFEFDRKQLESAGVNFEQEVEIDVKNATADEFFKSLFDPLGVGFQIDRTTVKLIPKRAKP